MNQEQTTRDLSWLKEFENHYIGPYTKERNGILTCSEKGKIFSLNILAEDISMFKIKLDKGYFSEQSTHKKCDYMAVDEIKNITIFIELKGKELDCAYQQILTTVDELQKKGLIFKKKYCSAITSKRKHVISNSASVKALMKQISNKGITILNTTNIISKYNLIKENTQYTIKQI
ncbi:hypothetical protein KJQ81_06935 [Campylobacter lari]|uniref:Uncharacterized protein n=1 Tax=Campylobacter lari TaxID=201 RepID=A0A6N6BAY2_CAMLA|nr:hypothetical protein [Campylobacter lari]EDP6814194.1 hypothetical protein [Campylobacter lari]MBT0817917.1 hypothetical protein [Campylobacter lari]MCH3696267.1 hypothetical protein [Campylobacter lari]